MSHKASSWLAELPPDALTNAEFRVLFHLCDAHNSKRDAETACFPSQERLLKVTGLSNGGLNNALNGLENKGFIRRRRTRCADGTRGVTFYILGCDVALTQEPTPLSGDGNQLHFEGSTISTFGGQPTPLSGDKPVREPKKEPTRVSARAPDGARGPDAEVRGPLTAETQAILNEFLFRDGAKFKAWKGAAE